MDLVGWISKDVNDKHDQVDDYNDFQGSIFEIENIGANKRKKMGLQEGTNNATTQTNNKSSFLELRILSLNVHGFSDPLRTQIIDKDIYALVHDFQPDVCCLQEVKHPFLFCKNI